MFSRKKILQLIGVDVWHMRKQKEVLSEVISSDSDSWEILKKEISTCELCSLHQTRTQTVFGVGDPNADWLFIGEAPGKDEDAQGEPFVGRAGRLLDEMIFSIDLSREKIFIANILKCRPPNNRDPKASEVDQCFPYLEQQVQQIDPKIIIAVGKVAAQNGSGSGKATICPRISSSPRDSMSNIQATAENPTFGLYKTENRIILIWLLVMINGCFDIGWISVTGFSLILSITAWNRSSISETELVNQLEF